MTTISPVHRALAIQEIVAAIVIHVDQPSTLAMARTSRGLCEPALDRLWEMPKVWDLARRIRPQLWTITRSTRRVREATLSFKVPLHDSNPEPPAYLGKRFEYYSKRVQTLVLGVDAHWFHPKERIVDPSVLSAWAAMPQLFPRLHNLWIQKGYLRQSTDPDALFTAWMRQPRIDELWMTVLPDDIALFERAQDTMARKWGDLELLHIEDDADRWSIDAERATPDMQRRWAALNGTLLAHATNLCDVRITVPVSWAGVLAASTLPALTALELWMVVELPQEECRLPSGAFPHLDTLAIVDSTRCAACPRHAHSLHHHTEGVLVGIHPSH